MNFSDLYFSRFFASNIYFNNYSYNSNSLGSSIYTVQPNFSILESGNSSFNFNFFVSPKFKDFQVKKNYFFKPVVAKYSSKFLGFSFPLSFSKGKENYDLSWYTIYTAVVSHSLQNQAFMLSPIIRLIFFISFIQIKSFALKFQIKILLI